MASITDVTISYPLDLTKQMLEYSGVQQVESGACMRQTRDDLMPLGLRSSSGLDGRRRANAGRPHLHSRALLQHLLVRASAGAAHQAGRTHRHQDRSMRAASTGTASRSRKGPNPQTGPFFVEGAEPGDMLVVTFAKIEINRTTGYSSGALAPYAVTPGSILQSHRAAGAARELDPRQGEGHRAARQHRHRRPRAAAAADARLRRRGAGAQGSDRHQHAGRVRRQHGLRRHEPGREGDAAGQRTGRAALHRRRPCAAGRRRSGRHRPRDVDGRRVLGAGREEVADSMAAARERDARHGARQRALADRGAAAGDHVGDASLADAPTTVCPSAARRC